MFFIRKAAAAAAGLLIGAAASMTVFAAVPYRVETEQPYTYTDVSLDCLELAGRYPAGIVPNTAPDAAFTLPLT